MLVDTGAAKGIMGTDTMKDYISDILSKYGKVIKVTPSISQFTGIGGRAEHSKGLAETPLGIPLPGVSEVTIDLDLLGDTGSQCPGLLPLSVMLHLQSSIRCGVLQGGDGIMILRTNDMKNQPRAHSIPRTSLFDCILPTPATTCFQLAGLTEATGPSSISYARQYSNTSTR